MRLVLSEELWRERRNVADNTLRDLHNSSDDTRAELSKFFIIIKSHYGSCYYSFKIIPSLKVSLNMHTSI